MNKVWLVIREFSSDDPEEYWNCVKEIEGVFSSLEAAKDFLKNLKAPGYDEVRKLNKEHEWEIIEEGESFYYLVSETEEEKWFRFNDETLNYYIESHIVR